MWGGNVKYKEKQGITNTLALPMNEMLYIVSTLGTPKRSILT
jgi:hypothetical protein